MVEGRMDQQKGRLCLYGLRLASDNMKRFLNEVGNVYRLRGFRGEQIGVAGEEPASAGLAKERHGVALGA